MIMYTCYDVCLAHITLLVLHRLFIKINFKVHRPSLRLRVDTLEFQNYIVYEYHERKKNGGITFDGVTLIGSSSQVNK